jgi:hypothetical protein
MKKLCCDPDAEVCNRLKVNLESVGIACTVRHEAQPGLFDDRDRRLPELWVLDDSRFDEAWALVQAGQESPSDPTDPDRESSDA